MMLKILNTKHELIIAKHFQQALLFVLVDLKHRLITLLITKLIQHSSYGVKALESN